MNGVELDSAVTEACDAELVECIAKEGIFRTEGRRSNASRSSALFSYSWNMVRR